MEISLESFQFFLSVRSDCLCYAMFTWDQNLHPNGENCGLCCHIRKTELSQVFPLSSQIHCTYPPRLQRRIHVLCPKTESSQSVFVLSIHTATPLFYCKKAGPAVNMRTLWLWVVYSVKVFTHDGFSMAKQVESAAF